MTPPRPVEDVAHELVETLLSAVERWTRKPITFPGPIVTRTSGEEEEPTHWLERVAAQRLTAYAAEQVAQARAEDAQWACPLCHCCVEKRHDGDEPCVSCETARAEEREACAKLVEGCEEYDAGDVAAQVAIRSGISRALAAALRART